MIKAFVPQSETRKEAFLSWIRKCSTSDRLRSVLLLWCILYIFCALFLVTAMQTVKVELQEVEKKDITARLDSFLKQATAYSNNLKIIEQLQGVNFLQGLDFIRIVKGGEQVLLTETNDSRVDFKKMTGVAPHASGVWVDMGNLTKNGDWVIVSKYHDPDVTLQAGKKRSGIQKLFKKIHTIFLWGILLSLPLTFILSLLLIRLGNIPMKRAQKEIETILAEKKSEVLLPENLGGELGRLYSQVNDLLRHNHKLIDEMQTSLDSVAHDLRTPMTRLRSVAEYGLQSDSDPDRLAESLSDCLEESERVLAMLNIMMSVAEAESGTMHLKYEGFDIGESIENVMVLYEYVAEENKITVTSELQQGIYFTGDRTRLTQVWANLLDNALKYGREGGLVHIETKLHGEDILVIFSDNGMGISDNEVERIWERFYRGDRSRSQQGLGLGLNLARAVIEAHGGSVSVTSNLGKGSRFEVWLKTIDAGNGQIV